MKKLSIIAILMCAFSGLMAQKSVSKNIDLKERAEKMSQKMKSDLGLNDKQYEKLLSLNTQNAEKRILQRKEMEAEMKARREEMKSSQEMYKESLKEILSQEQYIKYLEHRSERVNRGHGKRYPRRRMH